MSKGKRFSLGQGRGIGEGMMEALVAVCERIEIVGSVRRDRPFVHDVDLLLIPRMIEGERTDLAEAPGMVSLVDARLDELVAVGRLRLESRGAGAAGWKIRRYTHVKSGVPVDLYATTPALWPVQMVIRTGSAEHNVYLCQQALARGMRLHAGGEGLEGPGGELVPVETEKEVLDFIGVGWIEPSRREIRTRYQEPRR